MRALIVTIALVVVAAAGVFTYAALGSGEVIKLSAVQTAELRPKLVDAAEHSDELMSSNTTFCDVQVIGVDRPLANESTTQAYTSVTCAELIRTKRGDLTADGGITTPTRFTLAGSGSTVKVVDIQVPDDGEGYADSLNELLPADARREADRLETAGDAVDYCSLLTAARARYDLPQAKVVGPTELDRADYAKCG